MSLSDSAIYDYQQDWSINGVKVTFTECAENIGLNEFLYKSDFVSYGNVKIFSIQTIFKMKFLLFYKRTKSRDYFDMLTLCKK